MNANAAYKAAAAAHYTANAAAKYAANATANDANEKLRIRLQVVEDAIKNTRKVASEILDRSKRARTLPAAYKKSIADLSRCCVATLFHFDELKKELEK